MRERCITTLYRAIGKKNSGQHIQIHVEHDGKVGCNTVEYTMAFLYSDWLYFLWHGINEYTTRKDECVLLERTDN